MIAAVALAAVEALEDVALGLFGIDRGFVGARRRIELAAFPRVLFELILHLLGWRGMGVVQVRHESLRQGCDEPCYAGAAPVLSAGSRRSCRNTRSGPGA